MSDEQMTPKSSPYSDAWNYLTRGGLPEVLALAEAAKQGNAPKVQMETEMAIVLCHLAAETVAGRGLDLPVTADGWTAATF